MSDSPSSDKPRTDRGAADADEAVRPTIDTAEFCRRDQAIDGATPISRLPRLASDLFDDVGSVEWRLRGWQTANDDGGVDRRMALHAVVQAAVRCDRCLQRLPIVYDVDREYLLARTERQAAEVDADVDEYDVLVDSRRFDVLELVEDEAIMAQPTQAEHDDCALPAELADDASFDKPNPFAALRALKKPEQS